LDSDRERVIGYRMRPGQIRSAPAAPARDLAAVLIAIQTHRQADMADGPNLPCPSPNPSFLTRAGLCA